MKRFFTPLFLSSLALSAFAETATTQTVTLDLTKPNNPVEFEFDTEKGYWVETYNDADWSYFDSQIFSFSHLLSGNSYGGSTWDGFTVSVNGGDEDMASADGGYITNQWGCMAKGGIMTNDNGAIVIGDNNKPVSDKSLPYVIGYYSYYADFGMGVDPNHIVFSDPEPCIPKGMYVANAPYSYYTVLNGDAYAKAFEEGDSLTLVVHGLNEDYERTTSLKYNMIKYPEGGSLQASRDWEYVDLSALGAVCGLAFTMESTDASAFGPNTPTYFCLDKLSVEKTIPASIESSTETTTKVYPSKFDNVLYVKANKEIELQLFDTNGRVVLRVNLQEGENALNVDMLPRGIYVANVDGQQVKLIK